MIDTAVILAGGKGTRMGPLTADRPKPMVSVAGRPIIEWIILWLKKYDITTIVVSVDYKKEVIIDHLGDGARFGVRIITINDHSGCAETGDVFRHIFENQDLPENFVALNGDQIIDLPLDETIAFHEKHAPTATIVTCPTKIPYGILTIDEDNTVRAFTEKPTMPDIMMSTGIYIFNRSIYPYLPHKGLIEKETFTKLAHMRQLKAYPYFGFFTTINDRKDLEEAERVLRENDIHTRIL